MNIHDPTDNRETYVFPVRDIPGVDFKKHFNGYYIMMKMDLRWVASDEHTEFYKARVFSSDTILITYPSWPYDVLMDRDAMKDAETSEELPSYVVNAMDHARHEYSAQKEKFQWKHLLLQFPSGHDLSSKEIYAEAGEDFELKLESVAVEIPYVLAPGFTIVEHWASWTVARTDISPQKRGKIDPMGKSKSAALLQRIINGMAKTKMEEEKPAAV